MTELFGSELRSPDCPQQEMQCALPVMRAREISPTPPEIGKHQEIKRQLTTKPVGERPPPSRSRARAIDSHRAEEHWQPEVARRPTWSNGLSSDQLRTCNANQIGTFGFIVMAMSWLSTTYTRTSRVLPAATLRSA